MSGYQNSFSLKKNRFIENSGAHPGACPRLAVCAEGKRGLVTCSPGLGLGLALTLWYQILEGGRGAGLQQREPAPRQGRVGGVAVTAVLRWGAAGSRRGRRSPLSSGWGSGRREWPIQQAWPRPRRPCRPPPRPSSRRCLSGQFDGAQQTAGPHACGQRQRVSGARPGWPGMVNTFQSTQETPGAHRSRSLEPAEPLAGWDRGALKEAEGPANHSCPRHGDTKCWH